MNCPDCESLRESISSIRAEVNCRIEHGASSGGHLEYVQSQLDKLIASRKRACPDCEGEGRIEVACSACHGTGEGMHDGASCRNCKGQGGWSGLCRECDGTGEVEDEEGDDDNSDSDHAAI